MCDDPMGRGGAISNILAEVYCLPIPFLFLFTTNPTNLFQARASLKNPSRPFTPADNSRSLFGGTDYRPSSRPSSSFSVTSAGCFGDQSSAQSASASPRSSKYKGGVSSRTGSRNRSSRDSSALSNSAEIDKPPLCPGGAQNWGWSKKEEENVPNYDKQGPVGTAATQSALAKGRRRSRNPTDEAAPSPWDTSPTVSDSDTDHLEEGPGQGATSCIPAIEAIVLALDTNSNQSVNDLCDMCAQLSPLVDSLRSCGEPPELVVAVRQKALQAVSKAMVDVPPKLMVKLARLSLNVITSDWLEQDANAARTTALLRPSVALKSICQVRYILTGFTPQSLVDRMPYRSATVVYFSYCLRCIRCY